MQRTFSSGSLATLAAAALAALTLSPLDARAITGGAASAGVARTIVRDLAPARDTLPADATPVSARDTRLYRAGARRLARAQRERERLERRERVRAERRAARAAKRQQSAPEGRVGEKTPRRIGAGVLALIGVVSIVFGAVLVNSDPIIGLLLGVPFLVGGVVLVLVAGVLAL